MKKLKFDKELFKRSVLYNVRTLYRKTLEEATPQQIFQAVSYAIKDQIVENWMATQKAYEEEDPKMVYYMSMEFLMGRALGNNMINMKAYKEVKEALEEIGVNGVDGILLDLGVSSYQLDTAERGFSYHKDAPLDMRMSKSGITAEEVVNNFSENELADIFRRFGEEKFAGKIARRIVEIRKTKKIATTLELAEIIASSVPAAALKGIASGEIE